MAILAIAGPWTRGIQETPPDGEGGEPVLLGSIVGLQEGDSVSIPLVLNG